MIENSMSNSRIIYIYQNAQSAILAVMSVFLYNKLSITLFSGGKILTNY